MIVIVAVIGYASAACVCNPSNQECAVPGVVTSYYACDGSTTVTYQCSPGTGFISNNQTSGCADYTSAFWSCLNINNGVTKPPNCKKVNSVPQAASATSFWVCDDTNTANLVICPPNSPYFYASNGYLGCFSYSDWQKYTGYPNC